MQNSKFIRLFAALVISGMTGGTITGLTQTPPPSPSQTTPKSEPSAPAAPKPKHKAAQETAGHTMPFHGKLEAVDKVEKTLTVKTKEKDKTWTFQVTSHTKLSKEGKPATLADGVVGEDIAGFAKEVSAGKFEAVSVRFAAKAPGHSKPKKSKDEQKSEPKTEQKAQ